MSIQTFDPMDIAFLTETKMSVPSGHAAMKRFLESDGFLDHLTAAIWEIVEPIDRADAELVVQHMLHLDE